MVLAMGEIVDQTCAMGRYRALTDDWVNSAGNNGLVSCMFPWSAHRAHIAARYTAKYDNAGLLEEIKMMYPVAAA